MTTGQPYIDILAFAPHPDDAELGVGATLALHAQKGYRVGVVDLSRGELASNGDVTTRQAEAATAAAILGLTLRENLDLPDGHIAPETHQIRAVVRCLRRLRPQIVLLPVGPDRHPDHVGAEALIMRALFLAGLHNYKLGADDDQKFPPFRPLRSYGYLLHSRRIPDLIVDVSSVYDNKRRALSAFASQFGKGEVPTFINDPSFLQLIEARDRYFGSLIGRQFGEGLIFFSQQPLLVSDLMGFTETITNTTKP